MIDTKKGPIEHVVAFDCDDTLVMWHDEYKKGNASTVQIHDPYTNEPKHLIPHQRHIDLIKHFKGRGCFVIVWSQGGGRWAEEVVKALGIEDLVDLVMVKPEKYVDDLPCNEWMNRIYLPSEE